MQCRAAAAWTRGGEEISMGTGAGSPPTTADGDKYASEVDRADRVGDCDLLLWGDCSAGPHNVA